MKRLLSAVLAVVLLFTLSACRSEWKPFEGLARDQLSEIGFERFSNEDHPGQVYWVLTEEETQEAIELLSSLTVTGKNDEFYYGANWFFHLVYLDGTDVQVSGGSDQLLIDGDGFFWPEEDVERFWNFGNGLYEKYVLAD